MAVGGVRRRGRAQREGGEKKRCGEKEQEREKSERTGVAGKRLGQALLLIY